MNWKWLERNYDQFEAMKLCTAKWFEVAFVNIFETIFFVLRKFKNGKKKYNLSLNKLYHQPDLKTARAKQHINEVCEENISGRKNISVQFLKHMSCPDAIILWWLSINGMKNLSLKKNYINFLIYDVTFASLKYSSSYL